MLRIKKKYFVVNVSEDFREFIYNLVPKLFLRKNKIIKNLIILNPPGLCQINLSKTLLFL